MSISIGPGITITGGINIGGGIPYVNPNGSLQFGTAGSVSGEVAILSGTNGLSLTGAAWTVETWFNTTSTDLGSNQLFGKWDSYDATQLLEYKLFYYSSAYMEFTVRNTGGSNWCDVVWPAPSLGAWHHIAIVFNFPNVYVYIDGVAQVLGFSGSNTYAAKNGTVNANTGAAFEIGGGNYSSGLHVGQQYYGYISNLRINNTTAIYTSNFTPSLSSLTNVSGTTILLNTKSGSQLVDATGTYSPQIYGTVVQSTQGPF
jgi:hypothetical protein